MTQVDNLYETMTKVETGQDTAVERGQECLVSSVQEHRLVRFFQSLAASMSLQRRQSLTADRQQVIMQPADIMAQNYPHIYLRVMCG